MSTSTLYLDCISGLSGDMALGALLELISEQTGEAAEEVAGRLTHALTALPLPQWRLSLRRASKMGVCGLKVDVLVGEGEALEQAAEHLHAPHDHDHHHHDHDHHHHDHDHHHHDHDHHHHDHDHNHGYRYQEIKEMLEGSELSEGVKRRALSVFEALAAAEGKVHGVSPEEVHFHEVGMVDSVVDICGVCWCLEELSVSEVVSAPPPVGRGWVRCAHGVMPLPAPATAELLKGLRLTPTPLTRELITPTGAALLKGWGAQISDLLPTTTLHAVGWGAGQADLPDRPNLLRAMLFGSVEPPVEPSVKKKAQI